MLTDSDIAHVADTVLKAELSESGFDRSYVLTGIGPDGEPTLSVVARFRSGARSASGKAAIRAMSALRRELGRRGEDRYPLLRYEYPDDEVPALGPDDFDPSTP